jgi:excisionase family DNA binding protein
MLLFPQQIKNIFRAVRASDDLPAFAGKCLVKYDYSKTLPLSLSPNIMSSNCCSARQLGHFQGFVNLLNCAAVRDEPNGHLYSIDQAAEFLQIHRATMYRLIASGKIAYYRVLSNRVRFSRAYLEEFLQKSERNSARESATRQIGGPIESGLTFV